MGGSTCTATVAVSTTVAYDLGPASAFISATITNCELNTFSIKNLLDIFFIALTSINLDYSSRNVSEPCQGRATNNNAEIEAATRAAEQAKEGGFEKIRIHTDSRFVIDCVTKWIGVWKRNGWRTHRKSPVVNRRELQIMMDALKGLEVEWVKLIIMIMTQNSHQIFFREYCVD